MWKFIIGCVTISTRKIMRWLENVVGLFLMNPDRFRFQFGKLNSKQNAKHLENIYLDAFLVHRNGGISYGRKIYNHNNRGKWLSTL